MFYNRLETPQKDAAAMEEHVCALLAAGGVPGSACLELFRFPTDDAWVRDHGPVFLVRGRPSGPKG